MGGIGGRNRNGANRNKGKKRSGKAHGRKLTGPGVTKVVHPDSRKAKKMAKKVQHDANKAAQKRQRRKQDLAIASRVTFCQQAMSLFCDQPDDGDEQGMASGGSSDAPDRLTKTQMNDLVLLFLERFSDEVAELKEESERRGRQHKPNRMVELTHIMEVEKRAYMTHGFIMPDMCNPEVFAAVKRWDGQLSQLHTVPVTEMIAPSDSDFRKALQGKYAHQRLPATNPNASSMAAEGMDDDGSFDDEGYIDDDADDSMDA